jgi:hypothetical protein
MYEQYPTSGTPQQSPRVERPGSVRTAVRLMYAGAALSAVAVIVSLATIGGFKSAVLARDPNFTSTQVHGAEVIGIASTVVGGLIAIGLWLWMAWANGKGRNWARVVSAILFGINTLDLLVSIAQGYVAATKIVSVLIWLAGLGAIVFIFRKESAPFYQQP